MEKLTRIALIHATSVAIQPVADAFADLWPKAMVSNLLEDSLSSDLADAGKLDDKMTDRFVTLGRYVVECGADGILFTCSAFGPAIEATARDLAPCPVLKPNEAMFEDAFEFGDRIGMLATFQPSILPMEAEFENLAQERGSKATLETLWVAGAMDALRAGDADTHNRLIAEAAPKLDGCDAIMLAQFSTAQAQSAVEKMTHCPLLTSPSSAVKTLKSKLE